MDEPILEAPVETPVDVTPVDTTPTDIVVPDADHPDGTKPGVDDAEAMWGDIKPDEVPAIDPNAAPVIPPEFTKALSMSEYVKEPAHMEAAVQTASEVWEVVDGKRSASSLLEAMRGQNPQQYEKTILQDIIPYIEKITGQKFGNGEATPPDPLAEMRAEVERLKQQPALEAQQRQEQQQFASASTASDKHILDYIKSGNGIFEGDLQGAIESMAAQLPKLGITGQALMKQVLGGDTKTLEKAYKAAEKAETLKAKAYSDRVRTRYNTLKGSVPASKGGGTTATPSSEADLTTQSGRVKWMADQFKSGDA